jgi:hypothetical protein
VAARQEANEDTIHSVLLAYDDLANFFANGLKLGSGVGNFLIDLHRHPTILVHGSEKRLPPGRNRKKKDAHACDGVKSAAARRWTFASLRSGKSFDGLINQ